MSKEIKEKRITKKRFIVKKTLSGITGAQAGCNDCEWEYQGKNAMGLAAIHTKMTGHRTWADSNFVVNFKGEKEN